MQLQYGVMSCHTLFLEKEMIYLNFVEDRKDIADLLRIPLKNLTYLLFIKRTENCYTSFDIPKKTGGTRTINAPCEELKAIQSKLAVILWDYQQEIWIKEGIHPNLSHGFIKDKSIFSNAAIHKKKRYIINLDISNFFDSIHFGRVCGYFEKNRYFNLPHEAAVTIAQIACYKGYLPQGSPCSPIISNLICQSLDIRLLHLAKSFKLDYTRYADDLTFSTNNHSFLLNFDKFIIRLSSELERMGFSVNPKKTRLIYKDSKQTVTGLVVNEKINIDRAYYRDTRAMANRLYRTGEFQISGSPAVMNQLEGRFSFIDQIDYYNNKRDSQEHNVYNLCSRETDYQAFLFYKYFFASEKPVVLTEGKTDVIYLKAALKNLYQDYPELVCKNESGEFEYKLHFFKRTKRLRYFFNLSSDGADSFSYLYSCFSSTKAKPTNYCMKFKKLSESSPKSPVIIIFDNEMKSNRPLKKFLQSNKITEEKKQELKNKLCCCPIDRANLYLLTIPLPPGKDECEIEDLFDITVQKQIIDGREFDRKVEKGDKYHYGKDVFSKYIYSNYESIDFNRFRPLLDSLKQIVLTFS